MKNPRKIASTALTLLMTSALVGCVINPTPAGIGKFAETTESGKQKIRYGFIPDLTVPIIEQIRCEAKDALVFQAATLIDEFEYGKTLGERLQKDPKLFKDEYKIWRIDPKAYVMAAPFLTAGLNLTFDFDITETNTNSISAALHPTTSTTPFTLGITTASLVAVRKNKRTISVLNSQFTDYQDLDCPREKRANIKNFAYPLTGKIDLLKTFDTFTDFFLLDTAQNILAGLADDALEEVLNATFHKSYLENYRPLAIAQRIDKCDPTGKSKSSCKELKACYSNILSESAAVYMREFYKTTGKPKNPKLAIGDILTFTTTVSGGLEPAIEFSKVGDLRWKSLGLKIQPKRADIHKLTVNIVAGVPNPPKPKTEDISIAQNGAYTIRIQRETKGDPVPPQKATDCEGLRGYKKAAKVKSTPTRNTKSRGKQGMIPIVQQSEANKQQTLIELRELETELRNRNFQDNFILNSATSN